MWLTAQEAAERASIIRMGEAFLFIIVVLGCMWLFVRWKNNKKLQEKEAENAAERIRVTKNMGHVMTTILDQDGAWKEQFFILKRKYDVLESHCKNLEQLLDSAEKGKFVPKGGKA